MRVVFVALFVVVVLVAATPALAQAGCVNSPENPTAVLALVGSVSGVLVAVRGKFKK